MEPLVNRRFGLFDSKNDDIVMTGNAGLPVASADPHIVSSYFELLEKVASLHFYNKRWSLLFRGQSKDYRNRVNGAPGKRSCLYPSILRASPYPDDSVKYREIHLDSMFEKLADAEDMLKKKIRNQLISQSRLVRWALLQHYEICATPLLDVTKSLQTALSFACPPGVVEGHIYVLAVPHISGPLSVSVESMTQVVDLSQICPPEARRPHFQSGVLLGDYPDIDSKWRTHEKRGGLANNFSCRLLTKFHLKNVGNWGEEGFCPTSRKVLFPDDGDKWFGLMGEVMDNLSARYR